MGIDRLRLSYEKDYERCPKCGNTSFYSLGTHNGVSEYQCRCGHLFTVAENDDGEQVIEEWFDRYLKMR